MKSFVFLMGPLMMLIWILQPRTDRGNEKIESGLKWSILVPWVPGHEILSVG